MSMSSLTDAELLRMASELRLTLTRVVRQLRRADAGLSPTLQSALATVEHHGPVNLGDLAVHEGVRPPTMTRIVARLEALALITRHPDPADGRAALVRISPKGRRLLEGSRSRKTAYLARGLAVLSPEDRRTLARAGTILDRMLGPGAEDPRRPGRATETVAR